MTHKIGDNITIKIDPETDPRGFDRAAAVVTGRYDVEDGQGGTVERLRLRVFGENPADDRTLGYYDPQADPVDPDPSPAAGDDSSAGDTRPLPGPGA